MFMYELNVFAVCMHVQRHCRTFLLRQSHQQKLQRVIVLQAGVRRIIAEKQYRRMKLEVLQT